MTKRASHIAHPRFAEGVKPFIDCAQNIQGTTIDHLCEATVTTAIRASPQI